MADSIITGSPFNDFINGTDLSDEIDAGQGQDTVFASDGNDTISGGVGNDMLDGGAGDDTFMFSRGDGQDTVFAYSQQPGRDSLTLAASILVTDVAVRMVDGGDLLLNVRDSNDSVLFKGYFYLALEDRPKIVFEDGATWDSQVIDQKVQAWPMAPQGTEGDDRLEGGPTDDMLSGGGGNDTLYGDGGRDLLDGGAGEDVYYFGRGDGQDTVMVTWPDTAGEVDHLRLGTGIDMSNVSVFAEGGDLLLRLDGSSDSVRLANYFSLYGMDRPRIEFADGSYWDAPAIDRKLQGLPDNLSGTTFDDAIDGGAGDDMIQGMEGRDTLYGDTGRDSLDGGAGSDTYLFGRGDEQDMVISGSTWSEPGSADVLQLGRGINMADVDVLQQGSDLMLSIRGTSDSVRVLGYFNASPMDAMSIRFADGSHWDARAVMSKLSQQNDFLGGSPEGDALVGGNGNDFLSGQDGDDTLYGGRGTDTMDGGQGADTYFFGRGDGQDRILAYSQDAAGDKLQFASDIDVTDVEAFKDGSDLLIHVRNTSDSVRLVGYFNQWQVERPLVHFASGAVWDAATVDRKVYGASYPVAGTPADEFIEGGRWDDFLSGNDGDDTLYGDAGRDVLDGGMGVDTYLFGRGDAQDTVMAGWPMGMGQNDRIRFGSDIDMSNVSVTVDAADLILSVTGTSDSVRVANYFNLYGMDRPRIEFADGSYWDAATVDRKLQGVDDVLWGSPAGDMLDGGAGNDQLIGMDGSDTLYGDAGNDLLDGGRGRDTYVFGRGDGQDTIIADSNAWQGQGSDRLVLGQGIGMADLALSQQGSDLLLQRKGSTDSVLIAAYFNAAPFDRLNIEFADGSNWDGLSVDQLLMTTDAALYAQPQRSTIVGGQGSDALYGSAGDDYLYGDAGNDWLDGMQGADTFYFGRGDGQDVILTMGNEPGVRDVLNLGAGLSALDVDLQAVGPDLLLKLIGSADQVRLQGYFNAMPDTRTLVRFSDGGQWDDLAVSRKLYASPDNLYGEHGDDMMDGGAGDDVLYGYDGRDTLYGDSGNDFMDGGVDADTYLFGLGDGSDTIQADPQPLPGLNDVLVLGAGISMADLQVSAQGGDLLMQVRSTSDQVRLAGYLNAPSQNLMQIQFADGFQWTGADIQRKLQSTADKLVGTGGADGLEGGLGADTLQGLDGRDFLDGDQGNDLLDGGQDADTLAGGAGNDTYVIDNLGDVILEYGQDSDDQIIANVDGVQMANNVERLTMGTGNVFKASGNDGKNYIKGNSQNNSLWGYAGNDSLVGLEGADQFFGGLGDDTLVGATGNDSYYFSRGAGSDLIQDYDTTSGNSDKLYMEGDISASQLWFTRTANDLVISVIGTTDKVRVAQWFLSTAYRVETVVASGKTLNANNVQQLVNAMASMTPPPLGQTTLSASYNQKLGSVIASSWV